MRFQDPMFPTNALPDAPLAMPKQVLERRRVSIFVALRAAFAAALPRP
jgi:hypothetical protein